MLQFFGLFWAIMVLVCFGALLCFGALRSRPNAVVEPMYCFVDLVFALLWPIAIIDGLRYYVTMVNPKSLQNLKSFTSSDGSTDLTKISVRVPIALLQELDELPGDRSAKLRAAIALYLESEKILSKNP